ncbi:hypothetical protein B0O99DRAFT_686277 [Bisporella sp. PMI_857]|nr:hypothetical protein B0O99DRAFT_686277 [Bisporella sp. PMI_857]
MGDTSVVNKHFFFELPEHDLQCLQGFTDFEKKLLSCLAAAFQTGVKYHNSLNDFPSTDFNTDTRSPELEKDCEAYIKNAKLYYQRGDKFVSLRLAAPSLAYMKKAVGSIGVSAQAFQQIFLWRVFAFGHRDHLEELKFANGLAIDGSALTALIESWVHSEKLGNHTYGNLMIPKASIAEIVTKLLNLGNEISNIYRTGGVQTFRFVLNLIIERKIPIIPKGGLMAWLLACDIFEFGACYAPTVKDLDDHLYSSKATGPKAAIQYIKEWVGLGNKKTVSYTTSFTNVLQMLQNPLPGMVTLNKLVYDCERIQGRKLNAVDLEHALCKISRMWDVTRRRLAKEARTLERGVERKREREEDGLMSDTKRAKGNARFVEVSTYGDEINDGVPE